MPRMLKCISEPDLWQEARNKILLLENPDELIEVAPRIKENVGHAMVDIQEYLDVCYGMNDNPLRHLRRYFPKFNWEHHEITGDVRVEGRMHLFRVVSSSDYIWAINHLWWWEGVVTATQVGRRGKRRGLCYNDYNMYPYWPSDMPACTDARLVRMRNGETTIVDHCTKGPA